MRRRTVAIGAVVLGGAALLLFCCTGRGDRPADAPANPTDTPPKTETPPATAGSSTDAAAPTSALVAPTSSTGASPAPSASASASSGEARSVSAGVRIAETVQDADPHDLELLADIERNLKRDPPPEIHALIAARKRGASRDELTRSIRTLPDLRMRVFALRWLDRAMPAADAGAR